MLHTFNFPSRPQLTTFLFKLSIARPVTALVCPEDATALADLLAFDDGSGGNRFLRSPDCRLYISILPPAEPTKANVPQVEIATLCLDLASARKEHTE